MAESARQLSRVLVTGATGYVATEIVSQLLQRGQYLVRGTVRNRESATAQLLLSTFGEERFELVEADLLQEGAFDDAVKDVNVVFHTASPFRVSVEDAMRDLISPALDGTKNVLNAVARAGPGAVRRVVLTSSAAAIRDFDSVPANGEYFTHEDWNTTSTIESSPYMYSKAVAERAAWEIAERESLDLVVINPSFVMGPPISNRGDGTSIGYMRHWIETGHAPAPGPRNLVDVRDVAAAHIAAAEVETASGRYPVTSDFAVPVGFMARALAGVDGVTILEEQEPEGTEHARNFSYDRAAEDLGIEFHDLTQTLQDMARRMIDTGMATPLSQSGEGK